MKILKIFVIETGKINNKNNYYLKIEHALM